MTFGDRLRIARKQNKLTQKELAAKINAAHNSISNWENNQNMPDPDTIQHLCWALEVEPNFFFDAPETKNESAALSDDELTNSIYNLLGQLTPIELEKVAAFVQGLLASH